MKNKVSIALLTTILINIFSFSAFAEDADILNVDFENQGSFNIIKSETVEIGGGAAENDGTCLSFKKMGDKAAIMFSDDNSHSVSGGTLCIEFDVRTGFGGMGMTLMGENDGGTVYNKYIFSSGTTYSTPPRGLKAYTSVQNPGHPRGSANGTNILAYKSEGGSNLALSANKWQHVAVYADLENLRTKVTLDGESSSYITGYDYLDGISVTGIGFMWSLALSQSQFDGFTDKQKEAYIDNIRVYRAPVGVSEVSLIKQNGRKNTDLKSVSPMTDAIEVSFTEKMDFDSVSGAVSLFNITNSENENISASGVSEDGKTVVFGIDNKSLSENSDYKITVGECMAQSGVYTKEYSIEFATTDFESAERILYYSTDFESDTVGETPKNVYGHGSDSTDFAVVRQDGENKYMVTSTRSRFLFGDSVTNGSICADFDINLSAGATFGFGIVYSSKNAEYGKWPLTVNASGKMMYYDAMGANPPVFLEGHTFDLFEEGSDTVMSMEHQKWQNIKILMDVDSNKITVTLDGKKSVQTGEIPFIAGKNGIGGIVIYTSSTKEISLDNVKVYRPKLGILRTEITDTFGNVLTGNKIPSEANSINITFTDKIASAPSVSLKKNGTDEETVINWDLFGRIMTIKSKKGYFESGSAYTVTVGGGYTDEFERICEEDYEFSFETDEGGLRILGLSLEKDGSKISDLNGIAPGIRLNVCAEYILTNTDKKCENACLAVVFEKGERLSYIARKAVNLDAAGHSSAEFEVLIPENAAFDSAYVYLWDLHSYTPIVLCQSYTK